MKIWRYIILWVAVSLIAYHFNTIQLNHSITITKGDTYEAFRSQLSRRDRQTTKSYLKLHGIKLPALLPWSYVFDGEYEYRSFLDILGKGPSAHISKITILEGRSSKDIDQALTRKWLITAGQYVAAIQNSQIITSYAAKYPEIDQNLTSLEWYLYPDTYHLDPTQNPIDQLIALQLKNFHTKIGAVLTNSSTAFADRLTNAGYSFQLSIPSILKLASIIENEEKTPANKPTIAGIFLNRIAFGMQLDADYTICYGYDITYNECTPSFILAKLYDTTNPYNTRQKAWLPPTPISNPSADTVNSVLNFNKSDYIFYLHGIDGTIRYAVDLPWHNSNKQMYLK